MTDLGPRTVGGLAYGAVVLAAVLGPREVFLIGVAAMTLLALVELAGLRRAGIPAVLELAVLALGSAALVFLRDLAAFPFVPLLMTVLAVWAADVAAYAVGSLVGRRKIAPRISPGKTWEGTLAGFAAAGAVVAIASAPIVGEPWWILTAIAIGPAAFAGDLLESWTKRRAGVKDSGHLIPGHGGVLDRVDSLVAAAPAVAATIIGVFLLSRMG